MGGLQTGSFIIEILLAVGLTLLFERWGQRYIKKHPLAPEGPTRPVYFFGKASPLLSAIRASSPGILEGNSPQEDAREGKTPEAQTSLPSLKGIRVDGLLMLAGLGVVIGSQVLRWSKTNEQVLSYLLLVFGLAVFVTGLYTGEKGRLPGWVLSIYKTMAMPASSLLFLAAGLFFTILSTAAAGFDNQMKLPVVAVGGWLLGIGLTLAGGWKAQPKEARRFPWKSALWVLGLTALALPVRAINTTYIPINLSGDEGYAGLSALSFLNGKMNNLFISSYFSFPSLFSYFQAIWINLLGRTTEALRLPSAVGGALSVGAVYLLGKSLFNRRIGLLAALLLAAQPLHVYFSRIGLNNVWDGMAFIVTLGLIWYGWKHERRWAFLGAGIALGLAQYLYASGRSLLILIPLWCISLWLMDRKRFTQLIPDFVLMGFTAFIVVLPMGWYYLHHWEIYMAPMNRVSILGKWMTSEVTRTGLSQPAILVKQVVDGLRAYTDLPLRWIFKPGTPILRPVEAALFLLGSVIVLIRCRDARTWLLVLWLVLFGVIGGLSESTPASQRYVAATPAVVLVAAIGIDGLVDRFGKALPGRWRSITGLVMVLLALGLGLDDVRFFFYDYLPKSEMGGDNTLVAQRLADTLKTRTDNPQVLFFGTPRMGYNSIMSLPYLVPNAEGIDVNQPWGSADNPKPNKDHAIFVFLPEHEADMQAVEVQYPGGSLSTQYNLKGGVLYWQYETRIPAAP